MLCLVAWCCVDDFDLRAQVRLILLLATTQARAHGRGQICACAFSAE